MKVLVLGAGRMGIRHCLGVLKVEAIKQLLVADVADTALENARHQLEGKNSNMQIDYVKATELLNSDRQIDVVIIASTAGQRLEVCKDILKFDPKFVLIEKPLGQSYTDVECLIEFCGTLRNTKFFVNLNTRLYPGYKKLREDLSILPQFKGPLTFSINTGTVGIGANGIHYIDLVKYLTGAATIKIKTAAVDDQLIPSGRGPEFGDFGGFAVMDYEDKNGSHLARCHFILGSGSTVLGPWEIVGTNGRILIDEFEQTRFNKYRKKESELPVQRYAGDYLPAETEAFAVPFLNELTEEWLRKLIKGEFILPELAETSVVHEAMFNWLSYSTKFKDKFPVT